MITDNEKPDGDDTLRIGLLSPIKTVDPVQAHLFADRLVLSQMFEPPYGRPKTAAGRTEPLVFAEPLRAESGSVGEQFSASVREGLLFSDGTPLTAELAAASLRRASPLMELAEVRAQNDRVYFHLKRPNARFDYVLTQIFLGVTLVKDGKVLGTGPYVAAPDSKPEAVRCVRNPHYKPQPRIGELLFTSYEPDPDGRPTSLLNAVENGVVDFTNVLHKEDIRELKQVRKYFERGNSMAFLFFNTERSCVRELKVRKAIGMAIDRVELAAISYNTPMAFAAKGLLPPTMSNWRDGLSFNMDKAKQLIEEAGNAKPDKLAMSVIFGPRPYLPHPIPSAEYIARQLAELGIEVIINPTKDGEDFRQRKERGDYDMMLSGWVADTEDPADFLESLVAEEGIPMANQPVGAHCNMSRWRHPGVQDAVGRLRTEPGETHQNAALELVAEEVPLVPLMTGSFAYVHSYRVAGFEPTPLGIPYFSSLELRG